MESFTSQLKSNWFIVIFIAGLIATWTTFSGRLAQAESEIDQLSQVVSEINQINISIAEIRMDIKYISEKI